MYTIEMYNALVEAIATGTREVWYGSKRVAYRSLDEMLRLKELMEQELGLIQGRSSRVFGNFNKGTERYERD